MQELWKNVRRQVHPGTREQSPVQVCHFNLPHADLHPNRLAWRVSPLTSTRGKGFFKSTRIHLKSIGSGYRVSLNIVSETPVVTGPVRRSHSSVQVMGNQPSTPSFEDSIIVQSTNNSNGDAEKPIPNILNQLSTLKSEPSTQQIDSSFLDQLDGAATQQTMPTSTTLKGDSQRNSDVHIEKLILAQNATIERIMQAVEDLQKDMALVKQWVAPRPVGRPRKNPLPRHDSPKATTAPAPSIKQQAHDRAHTREHLRETAGPPSNISEVPKPELVPLAIDRCWRCRNVPPILGYRHCQECIDELIAEKKLAPPEKRTLSQNSNNETMQPPQKQQKRDDVQHSISGPSNPENGATVTSTPLSTQANGTSSKVTRSGPQQQDQAQKSSQILASNLSSQTRPATQPSVAGGASLPSSLPQKLEKSSVSSSSDLNQSPLSRFKTVNMNATTEATPILKVGSIRGSGRTETEISDTQEYLKKAIVEDPDDTDYAPSNHSASPSQAVDSPGGGPDVMDLDTLAVPVTTLKASVNAIHPESKDNRRSGGSRANNKIIFDGRATPEWERGDSDLDEFASRIKDPVRQSHAAERAELAHRGISKVDKGKQFTPPPKANPMEKYRDPQGYLLMSNGKRDGRSMRRKALADAERSGKKGQDKPAVGDTIKVQNGDTSKSHDDVMSKVFRPGYQFQGVSRRY